MIQTLVVEGGIQFTVEKIEDITDEMMLSASVNVIDCLAEQRDKLMEDLKQETELTKQFYKACQKANIRVSHDDANKIKLEALKI